ncbi:AbrB/MazE/SpoVT family DNA-binding domain-containing protein [Aquimonas voraii]|uniref:Putative addiction module antidote n=1 Tax=Aquimonas voraii TaxID=265719 RepID=A0A1G6RNN0_9GAMM|nr:AbrB/MazE/SpoVT family DNA-binding domain-containing protein [Aquimonas voraii]SDD06158.1 putative addiction module antidote [Aquimonas voraii]
MHTLRVIPIGSSLGVVLPQSVLNQLKLGRGDAVYLLDGPEGLRLSNRNPEHAEQIRLAHVLMHERRALLQQLAL